MDKNAVIYARVSSAGDRQDTSRQVADLEKYAAASGLDVVNIFEEKASGAKDDREVLADCITALRAGEAALCCCPNCHAWDVAFGKSSM